MKRLNRADISKANTSAAMMREEVKADFRNFPHVYELKAHGIVTLDMSPHFGHIIKTYKVVKDSGTPVELFKINNTTGWKTHEWINPLF